MGAALKKQYDKKLKTAVLKLSSAELRQYLTEGSVMIGEVKIQEGWLKVQKIFNKEYSDNNDYGCATDERTCVLLKTSMDDNLKQMGMSREITNRIQKLRKSTGISIDDQIEVFYTDSDGTIALVLKEHSDKIRDLIKMPFLRAQHKQQNQVVIGTTSFENQNE
jgi:isoleucyl-tRNA synthetase